MSESTIDENFVRVVKTFWSKYGNHLLTVVLVIAVIFTGWRYWNNYQQKKTLEASAQYQVLLMDAQAAKPNKEALFAKGNSIMTEYPDTVYAKFSALLLASIYVSENNVEAAKTSLKWVIDHSDNSVLKSVSSERLARILVEQKSYQDAINVLQKAKINESFTVSENVILGNAYAGLGESAQAKQAWQQALKSLSSPQDEMLKNLLRMKLNTLSDAKTVEKKS